MRAFQVLFLVFACLFTQRASAGIYTDDLSKCLVDSTTASDRTDLVVWMFAAASAHPAVAPLADVTPDQIEKSNQKAAVLLTRLLTESCLDSARKAFQYEGPVALQASMQVLGQVAGQELFSSPDVGRAMSGLERHFDSAGVKETLEAK